MGVWFGEKVRNTPSGRIHKRGTRRRCHVTSRSRTFWQSTSAEGSQFRFRPVNLRCVLGMLSVPVPCSIAPQVSVLSGSTILGPKNNGRHFGKTSWSSILRMKPLTRAHISWGRSLQCPREVFPLAFPNSCLPSEQSGPPPQPIPESRDLSSPGNRFGPKERHGPRRVVRRLPASGNSHLRVCDETHRREC